MAHRRSIVTILDIGMVVWRPRRKRPQSVVRLAGSAVNDKGEL